MRGASAVSVRRDVARLIRPPTRMPVTEAGRQYVKVRSPAGGTSPWDGELTPYMLEPMDLLNSRQFEAVIFVGPAQSGKTQALVDVWVGWMATCDPSDMMILQTSQETARDFSRRRIDRLHRQSPAIKRELSASRQHDNTFDKVYRGVNILSIGWPSINQLSGKPIKYMALTDYDRMPEDVDGEGAPFNLAAKRTTTFLSRGMTLVESSPGYEVLDPKWRPRTSHEAPPTRGILSLFNLGDRRRWYWPCQHCGEYFLQPPGIEGFSFPLNTDLFGVTDTDIPGEVGVPCAHCGAINGEEHKRAMIDAGRWVPEGCLEGDPRVSRIASFWLPGAAAAYVAWRAIVQKYLNALREYDITGSEESLKTATNVELGAPYLPRRLQVDTDPRVFERRAEDLRKRAVPPGVRFLVAAVDVQKNRFVVQVTGYGVNLEAWLIDRYDIQLSKRLQRDEPLPVDPAGHIEDWDLITEKVIRHRYPLADSSGRHMAVLMTACDSGGRAGVTERAYEYWRRLRRHGLTSRFMLVKGERPLPHAKRPRIQEIYPDNTSRSARRANARGEIPVYLLNTTVLKDGVHADLSRNQSGPGYVHFPDWLGNAFYEELAAEKRSDKGWDKVKAGAANEAFDLLCYGKAAALKLGAERIDWSSPPRWAGEWPDNSQVDLQVTSQPESTRGTRARTGSLAHVGLGREDWVL